MGSCASFCRLQYTVPTPWAMERMHPAYTWAGTVLLGRVVWLHDGDTATVAVRERDLMKSRPICLPCIALNPRDEVVFLQVRAHGIDTWEIAPHKSGRTPDSLRLEREYAEKATQYARTAFLGQWVWLAIVGWDKFGSRIVGDMVRVSTWKAVLFRRPAAASVVLADPNRWSALMLDQGHALPYDGKHRKLSFDTWYADNARHRR